MRERREVRGEEGREWKSLEKMVEMGNCRMRTDLAQLLPPGPVARGQAAPVAYVRSPLCLEQAVHMTGVKSDGMKDAFAFTL